MWAGDVLGAGRAAAGRHLTGVWQKAAASSPRKGIALSTGDTGKCGEPLVVPDGRGRSHSGSQRSWDKGDVGLCFSCLRSQHVSEGLAAQTRDPRSRVPDSAGLRRRRVIFISNKLPPGVHSETP